MRVLITAGPTREPIDAVRFISNRSSGKMGLAIAQAAVDAGHETALLLGPVNLQPPSGCRVYRFDSSRHLQQLIEAHFHDYDVLIMAAAVSDYRPNCVAEGKLPREAGRSLTLQLDATPDLVATAAQMKRPHQRVVAFAVEEQAELEQRAVQKMRRKGVDAIVANPLGTMEADAVTAVWFSAAGERVAPGRMDKSGFGHWLIEKINRWYT